MAVYITGDCHAEFGKFSTKRFPEQRELTKEDFVIVCGDFGVWHDCPEERYWLDWLSKKSFALLFVDGNHENFDRLKNEFPVVDFHGGKAHKIRDNVYHLMRGYVFDICGKKFFAFGGVQAVTIFKMAFCTLRTTQTQRLWLMITTEEPETVRCCV